MCHRLGGSQYLGLQGSCSAGSEEAGTEPREGLLSSFMALPLSAAFFFSYLVHFYSPVAPARVNEVFLSAEPAAVAQRDSG